MNELSTNICFDALSVVNNVQVVENVCYICSGQHYTQNCPEFSKGHHVKDKPPLNLSRSSVPNGLLIIDGPNNGTCVVTSQKFAKGTRFGPLLAQKSYVQIKNLPFPLVIFANPVYYNNEYNELQTLFNTRNVYLDTSNENKCNWMIHVNLARYSNEQNLICYQENDEIYYTAVKDIELGDILKVWYSRSYAAKIGAKVLEPSSFEICNNILKSVSLDYGLNLEDNKSYLDKYEETNFDVNNNNGNKNYDKISLPPIDSLMKTSSPKYTNHIFDLDIDQQFLYQPQEETSVPATSTSSSEILTPLTHTDLNIAFDAQPVTSTVTTSALFENNSSLNESIEDGELHKKFSSSTDSIATLNDSMTTPSTSTDENDKKYPCEICLRKYMTKSNLDKHMRKHNLFLCVFCMKLFHQPEELKDHECTERKAKTPYLHCPKCLKVLSNSWSLQRHMKIHKDLSENTLDEVEKVIIESKVHAMDVDDKSLSDEAKNCGQLLDEEMLPKTVIYEANSSLEMSIEAPNGKHLYRCIVCAKMFKNPNALEKHLRKVHTVYTVSNDYKPEKKVQNVNSQKKTAPVKPAIAKALATKLSQKNKKSSVVAENRIYVNTTTGAITTNPTENTPRHYTKRKNIINATNLVKEPQNKQHSIIIISNLELTNNNLIDTSQLFLNNNNNLSNKIDVKVLNSTDKLPKLVPISNHSLNNEVTTKPTLNSIIEEALEDQGDLLTLSPIKMDNTPTLNAINQTTGNEQRDEGLFCHIAEEPDEIQTIVQQQQQQIADLPIYKCEECDKYFPKNYQLKRHLETHENVYYTCPFCERPPLKAKTSLRKHLNTMHPNQISKEEMNQLIATRIVTDEVILRELHEKNQRKIRNKCTKSAATIEKSLSCSSLENTSQSNSNLNEEDPSHMLTFKNIFTSSSSSSVMNSNSNHNNNNNNNNNTGDLSMETGLNCEMESNSGKMHELSTKKIMNAGETNGKKRKNCDPKSKTPKKLNNVVKEKKERANKVPKYNGATYKYDKIMKNKQSTGICYDSLASGSHVIHQNGTGDAAAVGIIQNNHHQTVTQSHLDSNTIILDNLFDNISIDNYEFDDNTSIQSLNLIEEKFKTSFDQIQEKLDADLSFDEDKLQWQTNIIANDSSNEINDKLLNVEENLMLI